VLGIALGLAASVCWGISDFLGGLQSRRFSALSVLIVSQPVGALAALAVALVAGGALLPAREFAIAMGGGAAVLAALGAFYRAMALGSVSVVATIGALGVIVPVVGGIAAGEEPTTIQAVGSVLAVSGVVVAAREPDPEWREANRASVGLAALAALGFGIFFLAIDEAADEDPIWTIVAARSGGLTLLAVAAIHFRPSLPRARGQVLAALLTIGLFDVLANSLYSVATTHGLLALVAVAGSLYSAVTVLLARFFLGERLEPSQRAGVAIALAGVALIAAGT
jgi:drug/metabolite transporter (DMT)-like permease